MPEISERAIEIASSYLGKTESRIRANWADWLEDLMKRSGNPAMWQPGEAYCIAALSAIFKICCDETEINFPIPFSKSTQFFFNSAARKNFTHASPERGDIVIFEIGTTNSGHAELITSVRSDGISTIGFNTSGTVAGSQHNGDGVYAKFRRFALFQKTDKPKMWIRGYVATSQL